jgi:hypothetical protein
MRITTSAPRLPTLGGWLSASRRAPPSTLPEHSAANGKLRLPGPWVDHPVPFSRKRGGPEKTTDRSADPSGRRRPRKSPGRERVAFLSARGAARSVRRAAHARGGGGVRRATLSRRRAEHAGGGPPRADPPPGGERRAQCARASAARNTRSVFAPQSFSRSLSRQPRSRSARVIFG